MSEEPIVAMRLRIFAIVVSICMWGGVEAADSRRSYDLAEVDGIFSLLAYAVVYKDWQSPGTPNPRGYNIGAVLVDRYMQPVFWARNANFASGNTTQHAEIRLIHYYLNCSDRQDMQGYTIYTTLEPCAMCAGMMGLSRVSRVVFGQEDPLFGNALERLAADHSATGGEPPYPRLFQIEHSTSPFAARLDETYMKSGDRNIVRWLHGEGAREIYASAYQELLSMDAAELKSDAGRIVLDRSRKFLRTVDTAYVADPASMCGPRAPSRNDLPE